MPMAKGRSGGDCDIRSRGDSGDGTLTGRGLPGRPTTTKGLFFAVGELNIAPMGVPTVNPFTLFMLPSEPAPLWCRVVTGGGGASGT